MMYSTPNTPGRIQLRRIHPSVCPLSPRPSWSTLACVMALAAVVAVAFNLTDERAKEGVPAVLVGAPLPPPALSEPVFQTGVMAGFVVGREHETDPVKDFDDLMARAREVLNRKATP